MTTYRLLITTTIFLLVSGCATMDKSECREADWRMIGLEDGAKGHPVSYVGKHRKACAEHGVTPNLAQYESGHMAGLQQFCTAPNGFKLGRAGRGYNDVCPAELQGRFLAGYETGRELYDLSSEINHLLSDVSSHQSELAGRVNQSQAIEARLVSSELSSEERKALLDRFKLLQTEIAALEIEIQDLELGAARMQGEFEVLNSQHGY